MLYYIFGNSLLNTQLSETLLALGEPQPGTVQRRKHEPIAAKFDENAPKARTLPKSRSRHIWFLVFDFGGFIFDLPTLVTSAGFRRI